MNVCKFCIHWSVISTHVFAVLKCKCVVKLDEKWWILCLLSVSSNSSWSFNYFSFWSAYRLFLKKWAFCVTRVLRHEFAIFSTFLNPLRIVDIFDGKMSQLTGPHLPFLNGKKKPNTHFLIPLVSTSHVIVLISFVVDFRLMFWNQFCMIESKS